MTIRYFIFIAGLVAAVAISVAMRKPPAHARDEVDHSMFIKFSHTAHVKERQIACEDCHTSAKASKISSDNLLGDHESCQSCHETEISNNCTYCHTSQDNIVSIPSPERELIFSHEVHASTGEIACEKCHAGIENVTVATSANMPSMSTCMNCHVGEKVSINCETCHTDFVSRVPQDHLAADFRKDHKKLVRVGMVDVSCATCHSDNSCQDCHTGTELQAFVTNKDLMAEPASRTFIKDSPKQLKLQQVHGLNYRFTHPIDARSKLLDCASCHEQQTFCVTCHEAGGNINQQKFKPASHLVAGFTTIGQGTGGGRHAELGRRDIESCVSCHDVQGADPTCVLCHSGK